MPNNIILNIAKYAIKMCKTVESVLINIFLITYKLL